MTPKKRTFVYIDSFNLYYGILRSTRNSKWLKIDDWLSLYLNSNNYDIQKIKYFTANVTAQPHDLQKPVRQATYFRALQTIPTVEIIKGKFKTKTVNIQVTKDVKIAAKVPEEKGTDVNLAVHLVNDAHLNLCDVAVVVSNDSDLAEALAITGRDLHKEIWLINPGLSTPTNNTLSTHATQIRKVRVGQVLSSQFNPTLTDRNGSFSKPSSW